MTALAAPPARGKPADYGQEIVARRRRRTLEKCRLAGKKVLDFGCGNGAQTVEFIRDGCRIVALDVDEGELKLLSDYLRSRNERSILPVRYDGRGLPVADASVDVVLCYEVIEHVGDEELALREIRRVLKPGGEAVISVPNKAWIFETHGARLPLLPWNRVPFFSWLPDSIHGKYANARIYRRSEIVAKLSQAALRVRSAEYITAPMDVVKIGWLKNMLRSTIFTGDVTPVPFYSTSILVHCVKEKV
jgi:2-polyprenyl-3-methyl-5-hydroxy-6-metoxy-1,4-benzoquinol methylase